MNIQDLIIGLRQGVSGGDSGTLVLSLVILVTVILVVTVIWAIVSSRTPSGRIDILLDERAGTRGAGRWPVRIIVLAIVVAAFAFGGSQMDQVKQCQRCHKSVDYAATVKASPHEGVSCLACHGQPGPLGTISEAATYVRWIYVYTSTHKDPEPRPGSVSSTQCLRCHQDVSSGTVERYGVRVRHSDFLDTNGGCWDCHGAVAHGDASKQPTEPTMNKCVVCHDGKTASGECEYCHVQDPISVDAGSRKLPKVMTIDTSDCYSCHDQKPCLQCHGVTMPHPKGWAPGDGGPSYTGSHARQGFADRELCWRCHFEKGQPFVPSDASCSCHGLRGKMHGGAAWVKEHGLEATGKKTGQFSQCFDCHTTDFCAACHPANYRDLYKPLPPGPDSYKRDIPFDPNYWEY